LSVWVRLTLRHKELTAPGPRWLNDREAEDCMGATANGNAAGRTETQLTHALGEAVVHIWSHLPPDVQHDLFEEAITARGEAARQQLAVFLHAHHARTTDFRRGDVIEPDSLGG
jgi:hypothetical protein